MRAIGGMGRGAYGMILYLGHNVHGALHVVDAAGTPRFTFFSQGPDGDDAVGRGGRPVFASGGAGREQKAAVVAYVDEDAGGGGGRQGELDRDGDFLEADEAVRTD